MFTTIIASVDGTHETEQALEYSLELRRMNEAHLMIVWVVPRPEPIHAHPHGGPTPLVCTYRNEDVERDELRAHLYLDDLGKRYDLDASTETFVRVGDLAHQAKLLASSCDHPLLVLASRCGGETGYEQSVTQHLMGEAAIPVLAVLVL